LYTVPAATTAIVTEIVLTNTTNVDLTATITFGGTIFLNEVAIPADGVFQMGLKQVLSATETIVGTASATGVNVFISGVNVT
jgi:hypothetical protein